MRTLLEACGPDGLGALLNPAAGVPEASLLTPPCREQLMRVAAALIAHQWKVLASDAASLSRVMRLLAAGLQQPSDVPTFRLAVEAVVKLHERWASGGAVGAAMAALGGAGVGGGQSRPAEHVEEAAQLRGLLLSARLEPSLGALHEDTADALHAALCAEARKAGVEPSAVPHAVTAAFWQLASRCLSSERWLAQASAQQLLAEHAQAEVGDQQSFRRAASKLASAVAFLRTEAAHAERGWGL